MLVPGLGLAALGGIEGSAFKNYYQDRNLGNTPQLFTTNG